eukprot:g4067.t1
MSSPIAEQGNNTPKKERGDEEEAKLPPEGSASDMATPEKRGAVTKVAPQAKLLSYDKTNISHSAPSPGRGALLEKITRDFTGRSEAKEKKRKCVFMQCLFSGVLYQHSTGLIAWDIATFTILFWIMLSAPFALAFAPTVVRFSPMWYFNIVIDAFFWIDLCMRFRVTYTDPKSGEEVVDVRKIAMRYLKGWFFIDFIAVFPFDVVLGAYFQSEDQGDAGNYARLVKLIRLFKLTKLLRVLKFARLLDLLEDRYGLSKSLLNIFSLLCVTVGTLHLLGCIFYFISDFNSAADVRELSWFEVDSVGTADVMSRYLAAVYWATTTITTVGYGDITPNTDAERVACIFGMIIGAGMYGYIIAQMSQIVGSMNLLSEARASKLLELNAFME